MEDICRTVSYDFPEVQMEEHIKFAKSKANSHYYDRISSMLEEIQNMLSSMQVNSTLIKKDLEIICSTLGQDDYCIDEVIKLFVNYDFHQISTAIYNNPPLGVENICIEYLSGIIYNLTFAEWSSIQEFFNTDFVSFLVEIVRRHISKRTEKYLLRALYHLVLSSSFPCNPEIFSLIFECSPFSSSISKCCLYLLDAFLAFRFSELPPTIYPQILQYLHIFLINPNSSIPQPETFKFQPIGPYYTSLQCLFHFLNEHPTVQEILPSEYLTCIINAYPNDIFAAKYIFPLILQTGDNFLQALHLITIDQIYLKNSEDYAESFTCTFYQIFTEHKEKEVLAELYDKDIIGDLMIVANEAKFSTKEKAVLTLCEAIEGTFPVDKLISLISCGLLDVLAPFSDQLPCLNLLTIIMDVILCVDREFAISIYKKMKILGIFQTIKQIDEECSLDLVEKFLSRKEKLKKYIKNE